MAGVLTRGTGNDFHYQGTTDGGPPSSGSFTAGDWVEDRDSIWVCTNAGAPGEWVDLSTQSGTFASVFNVLGYGADPSGGADSGVGFRAAIAAAEAEGGGTVWVPRGTYSFLTFDPIAISTDEYALVRLGDNVSLVGEAFGAVTIKMDSTVPSTLTAGHRISFIGTKPATAYQQVRNFIFDADGYVLTEAFESMNMVRADADDVLLENLYGENLPGRNMVVVGSDSATANDRRRTTLRNVQIINGAQNVPGNAVADDCSFVYLNGDDHLVEECRFENEAAPVIVCGGVEAHGSNIMIRHNTFRNLSPAIYTGHQDGVHIAYHQDIGGNVIDGCDGGVVFIDRHIGGSIHHNQFSNGIGVDIFSPRNNVSGVARAGVISLFDIIDNMFTAGTTTVSVQLAGWQKGDIDRNSFSGYKEPVVFLSSTTDLSVVRVRGNDFLEPPGDAGVSQGMVHIAADSDTWGGVMSDIYVEDNLALKSGAAPDNTYMMMVSGDPGDTTLTRVAAKENRVVNLSDSCIFFGAFQPFVTYSKLVGNALLARNYYAAGSAVTATSSSADIDAVNQAITFTVPASGAVLVYATATALCEHNNEYFWVLREASADVAGTQQTIGYQDTGSTVMFRTTAVFLVTGLTPGASLTYKLGHLSNSSGGDQVLRGATRPISMEVWAA